MLLGKRLAARRAAQEVRELDLGHGQHLKYRLPNPREYTMRVEALESQWRLDNNLPPNAPVSNMARYALAVLAMNELVLVGWGGIVDDDGNEIPDRDKEGKYDAATGYDILSFEDVGLLLQTEVAKLRQSTMREVEEGKKASSPRSGGRRAKAPTGAKSKRGGGATKKSTTTRKRSSSKSPTRKPAASGSKT